MFVLSSGFSNVCFLDDIKTIAQNFKAFFVLGVCVFLKDLPFNYFHFGSLTSPFYGLPAKLLLTLNDQVIDSGIKVVITVCFVFGFILSFFSCNNILDQCWNKEMNNQLETVLLLKVNLASELI